MALDPLPLFAAHPVLAAPDAVAMPRSRILAIAAEVRSLRDRPVADFTVGDFDAREFPAPPALLDGVERALRAGHTNYPPAAGVPELREAVARDADRTLGVAWPAAGVVVGSGARPPIHAAFMTLLAPGDLVVYPVPGWNTGYYVRLARAREQTIATSPERGFMPVVDDLLPHLGEARLLCLNSPNNPCGTVIDPGALAAIAQAVVDENRRRERTGRPALFLLYDMVYRHLVYGPPFSHPVALVPEVAPYTLLVDAISKTWAATGLRVGWALVPPAITDALVTHIGHVGAWAGRAEQIATAELLDHHDRTAAWSHSFRTALQLRLQRLGDGLRALSAYGVHPLAPQAALYLSCRFEGLGDDEAARHFLLHEAGIGIVPFSAFGAPDGTGWVRFSVGAVSVEAIDAALTRLGAALARRFPAPIA